MASFNVPAGFLAASVILLAANVPAVAGNAPQRPEPACETFRHDANDKLPADRAALNASVVCLTVNTAFTDAAPNAQRRLLAMLLLISAQPAHGSGR